MLTTTRRLATAGILASALVAGSWTASVAQADEPIGPAGDADADPTFHLVAHPWDRYVRRFRQDHNFALSAGASTGKWLIQHFANINDATIPSSAAWARFQYSFNVPIYKGFGYMLGSSAGYFYQTADRKRTFQPVSAFMFPGVLGGLVYNVSPDLRISSAFDVSMERHNGMGAYDATGDPPLEKISVTMISYDIGVFVDLFYDLNWAVRVEAHNRRVYAYPPLHQPGDTNDYTSDATLRLEDRWYGLGIAFHLL